MEETFGVRAEALAGLSSGQANRLEQCKWVAGDSELEGEQPKIRETASEKNGNKQEAMDNSNTCKRTI